MPLSPSGLGPWGYMVTRGPSAILVDVPLYSDDLAAEVCKFAPGGVSHLFLTHDDFVGMSNHASWKQAFPDAVRVAHSEDCAKGSVEVLLSGSGPWEVAGFRVDHVPGHSAGSLFYACPELEAVFTGDSIGLWQGRATGFGAYCRFGRGTQARSLRGYARAVPFCLALLPGHGLPQYFEDQQEFQSFFDAAAEGLDGGRNSL